MTQRLTAWLVAVPAILVGLVVAAPTAQAASPSVSIGTVYIGVATNGSASVKATCSASSTCKGTVALFKGTAAQKLTSYSIPAKTTQYITVALVPGSATDPNDPANPERFAVGEVFRVSGVTLRVVEKTQGKATRSYTDRTADTKLAGSRQQIEGTVSGSPGSLPMSDLVVRAFIKVRGGNIRQYAAADVAPDGTYSFSVPMDRNNNPTATYHLQIQGVDRDGSVRSWWWRGVRGTFYGGSRYERDASSVVPTKLGNHVADFRYSFIQGSLPTTGTYANRRNVDISVASPPSRDYGSDTKALRELDIERCADVFGHTRTNSAGDYRVDFLPATTRSDNRYLVGARSGDVEVWAAGPKVSGDTYTRYGSCYDATSYSTSFTGRRTHLLTLPQDAGLVVDVPLDKPQGGVQVTRVTSGFTPTTSDKFIRIREQVPGASIMDAPVVAEGTGTTYALPPGRYWLETGRRTGCSAWYASRFTDNNAYFKGADRGAERWKTVNGRVEEYSKSVTMGYVRKTPPSGYKGWMYRGHCKSLSAGTINTFTVADSTTKTQKTTSTARKGAVVKGTVKRNGGRTNKEMMVRLSRADGTTVLRTDLADGSGRFYVAGLAAGTYTISVNSDSWRGIGRSFKGKHTIKVSGSGTFNAGTLYFRG